MGCGDDHEEGRRCRSRAELHEISKKALPAGTLTFMSRILMHWRQNSRRAMSGFQPLKDDDDRLRDLKSRTLMAIYCSSASSKTHNLTILFSIAGTISAR